MGQQETKKPKKAKTAKHPATRWEDACPPSDEKKRRSACTKSRTSLSERFGITLMPNLLYMKGVQVYLIIIEGQYDCCPTKSRH